jgi:putative transposase
MSKTRSIPAGSEAPAVPLLAAVRNDLMQLVVEAGATALSAILAEEVSRLCGSRHSRRDEAAPRRWGEQPGQVVLGGRRVRVARPRVRQQGHEVALPSYQQFQSEDPLHERALEQMLVGVSTRKYARSLESMPGFDDFGKSKSAMSRRLVAMTQVEVESLTSKRLEGTEWAAVMVDGLHFGEHVVLVALGIDAAGKKHLLGLREGSTENATVCTELLSALVERGLPQDRHLLFVIDGGKGLRKAIRAVFGSKGLVQRCQVHKKRNVLEHLPEHKRGQVSAALSQAYAAGSCETAEAQLKNLARSLSKSNPGAAESVREGLEETLTVKRLGITGRLEKTLSTTNPIENANGTVRRVSRRVRRVRDGNMALRWVGASLLEAERGFRRLKGHRDMPQLMSALRALDENAGEIRDANNANVRRSA